MKIKTLKEQVLSGMLWSFGERIGSQLIALIIQIILARLLLPEEYGTIAIALVFISILNIAITNGLSASLIQKHAADDIDFSTAFFLNLVFSLVVFLFVVFSAPYISLFFNMPILSPVLQALALGMPIGAINSVQRAYVSRNMLFARFFVSTLVANTISGIVGIIMALNAFGIWALVVQNLLTTTLDAIILWITVKWRPRLSFSWKRLGKLYSYGWKVLASNLLYEICRQLKSILVGKFYSPGELAFFNRGEQLPALISINIDAALQSALFPAMSQVQYEPNKLTDMLKKTVSTGCYIIFPAMTLLGLVADPLIEVILTEKWLPCVPFVWAFCVAYALQTLQSANIQAIRAIGRSDIALAQDIIKRIIDIVLLLTALPHGVLGIALAGILSSIIAFVVNAIPSKRLFNYGIFEQLKDTSFTILFCVVTSFCVFPISFFVYDKLALLGLQCLCGVTIFILLSILFKNKTFYFLISTLKGMVKNNT